MKSTPYWTPARSAPPTSRADRVHRAGADGDRVVVALEVLEQDVPPDGRVVVEGDAEPLDEADVHLDGLARQPERRHPDQHRPAAVGKAVEDRHLVALDGELAAHGQAGGPRADDGDLLVAGRDLGDDVRDPRCLVPLHEEPLHGPDREGPVDVAAAAGALAGRGADVRAHRGDRVRVAREDVPLLEPTLGGEVEVAAAVRPDRARLLALDVALEPGRVDRLDEEFLVRVDGHDAVACLLSPGDQMAHGRSRRARLRRRPMLHDDAGGRTHKRCVRRAGGVRPAARIATWETGSDRPLLRLRSVPTASRREAVAAPTLDMASQRALRAPGSGPRVGAIPCV